MCTQGERYIRFFISRTHVLLGMFPLQMLGVPKHLTPWSPFIPGPPGLKGFLGQEPGQQR